jgi:hypothetical protein
MAETVEIGPGSAAAAEPTVAPPTDIPENIEEAIAASIRQLSVCKLEEGYVKLLRDSMTDSELLLACVQWMVSQRNERCSTAICSTAGFSICMRIRTGPSIAVPGRRRAARGPAAAEVKTV